MLMWMTAEHSDFLTHTSLGQRLIIRGLPAQVLIQVLAGVTLPSGYLRLECAGVARALSLYRPLRASYAQETVARYWARRRFVY
jgi:hypothetical protein